MKLYIHATVLSMIAAGALSCKPRQAGTPEGAEVLSTTGESDAPERPTDPRARTDRRDNGFSPGDAIPDAVRTKRAVIATRLYPMSSFEFKTKVGDAKASFPANLPEDTKKAQQLVFQPRNAFEELDDIYGLMALAVVHADWQRIDSGRGAFAQGRGHNIGGILVNDNMEVVGWERNSNHAMCNGAMHGEVRGMLRQMNQHPTRDLKGHTIYTSLEPCMMCSGMMMQQKLLRTVFMQTDESFGKNVERLTIDTAGIGVRYNSPSPVAAGFGPAARGIITNISDSEFRIELDTAWRDCLQRRFPGCKNRDGFLVNFLKSDVVENIYRRARQKFENYKLKFPDETAQAIFMIPESADKVVPKDKVKKPRQVPIEARFTNKQLYEDARAFFRNRKNGIRQYEGADGRKNQNIHAIALISQESNIGLIRQGSFEKIAVLANGNKVFAGGNVLSREGASANRNAGRGTLDFNSIDYIKILKNCSVLPADHGFCSRNPGVAGCRKSNRR